MVILLLACGGPVGLMTAGLLQQRGVNVTVYERDLSPDARISGGTLDLHATTGQRALQAAGLLAAFYQLARPTPERAADRQGVVLRDEQPTEATAYEQAMYTYAHEPRKRRRRPHVTFTALKVMWNSWPSARPGTTRYKEAVVIGVARA